MPGNEFYHDDDAEQILTEAARISESVGRGISREKLIATAAELGISAEAVAQAEANLANRAAEVMQLQNESALRSEYASEIRLRQRVAWTGWMTTSAICVGINLFTSGFRISELSWSLWVAGIYGAFCIKDFVMWLFGRPERDEAGFRAWLGKRELLRSSLATVGMTIPQLDLLLESKIESGVTDTRRLVSELCGETGLAEVDSRLAVKSFLERHAEFADEHNVEWNS